MAQHARFAVGIDPAQRFDTANVRAAASRLQLSLQTLHRLLGLALGAVDVNIDLNARARGPV